MRACRSSNRRPAIRWGGASRSSDLAPDRYFPSIFLRNLPRGRRVTAPWDRRLVTNCRTADNVALGRAVVIPSPPATATAVVERTFSEKKRYESRSSSVRGRPGSVGHCRWRRIVDERRKLPGASAGRGRTGRTRIRRTRFRSAGGGGAVRRWAVWRRSAVRRDDPADAGRSRRAAADAPTA
jgi:hypothetical protein